MTLPQDAGPPLDWQPEDLDALTAIGPAEQKAIDAYAATLPPLLRAMYGAEEYQPDA